MKDYDVGRPDAVGFYWVRIRDLSSGSPGDAEIARWDGREWFLTGSATHYFPDDVLDRSARPIKLRQRKMTAEQMASYAKTVKPMTESEERMTRLFFPKDLADQMISLRREMASGS